MLSKKAPATAGAERKRDSVESGGRQVGRHEVPVHQLVEEGADVVGAAVLVVEVVSVLPYIHGEQRLLAMGQGQIGIAGFGHLEGAVVENQPGPAATELGGTGGLEGFDELLEAAEVSIDLVEQGAAGAATTVGLDALPVKAVVPHLGGIVEHAGLAGITCHGGDGVFQALAFQLGASHQVVEVGHVSVVVLAVVELKGLAGNMGLERIEAVGQRRQRMSHGVRKRAG